MRFIWIALLLGVAACTSQNKPLPQVNLSDPIQQLNPDRWTATANDLITPPGDGSPRRLPQPRTDIRS